MCGGVESCFEGYLPLVRISGKLYWLFCSIIPPSVFPCVLSHVRCSVRVVVKYAPASYCHASLHLMLCHPILSSYLDTTIMLLKVISEYVYPVHFGMADTEEEREGYKQWMEPVTHVYSKGMATPQEAAVSKVQTTTLPLLVLRNACTLAARGSITTSAGFVL